MKNMSVRKLAAAAVIAAAYAALTMLLAPISYNNLQFRISEALCILPFFFPFSSWGLFVGCLIANLMSPAGPLDVVFGSLATLIACLATAAMGKWGKGMLQSVLGCLMPVAANALIVGAVLALTLSEGGAFLPAFAVFALEVGLGEAAVMLCIGLPLTRLLPKSAVFNSLTKLLN